MFVVDMSEVVSGRTHTWVAVIHAMKEEEITKSEMARRISTSRSQLDRLLDPKKEGGLLKTLQKAAAAVGRTLRVDLV